MYPLQVEQTPNWLQDLFTSEWAFLVLFLICILEGMMMLRFMPSELVVPSALFLIGSSPLEAITIVIVAIVGTTIGQLVLLLLVRRGGREFILRSRWLPFDEEKLDRFDSWFNRWGTIAVPVSNTLLFVRGLLTFPAGLSDMDWRKFVALSALGSTSFQTILASLYIFGGEVLV